MLNVDKPPLKLGSYTSLSVFALNEYPILFSQTRPSPPIFANKTITFWLGLMEPTDHAVWAVKIAYFLLLINKSLKSYD